MAVKLPLAVRKDLRDSYESSVAKFQERAKNALGEDYTLEPSIDAVYPVAETADRGSQLGQIIKSYFDNALDGIESLTKNGQDSEAAELFNSMVPNRKLVIVIDKDAGFTYCGPRFQDGDFQLVINPENLWTNVPYITENLDRKLDMALYKQKGELPLGVRRGEKEYLLPGIQKAQAKFKKMFNKDFTFEYDLFSVFKERHTKTVKEEYDEESWFRNYGNSHVPNMIKGYFMDAADGLEYQKFGTDDMLQEAFVEAVENSAVVFKLVNELPSGVSYKSAAFEDGKLVLFTTAEKFGVNVDTEIVSKVVDLL